MNKKYDLSDNALSLRYGLALITFGAKAVEVVIAQKKWKKKYPDLLQQLMSAPSTKYETALPGELLLEIAGRDECLYDFYASPDGERLYTKRRHEETDGPRAIDIEIQRGGYHHLPNQEALLDYGALCLFKAADSTYGKKGES